MIKQQRLIALQLQQQEFACLHWFLELEDDCQHAVWHPCSGYRPSEEYAKERLFCKQTFHSDEKRGENAQIKRR